jgi:tetratricopeptide (TPR) repeat protein
LEQAQDSLERGDLAQAAAQYQMMVRLVPNDYEAARKLAEIKGRAGLEAAEIDKYLQAREIWPSDPAVHRSLGWAFYKRQRWDEAAGAFREAHRLDPRDVEALRGLGESWLEKSDYSAAAQAFTQALGLAPNDAMLQNSLGITCMLWGRKGEALEHFQAAVQLNPQPAFKANLDRARAEALNTR